jgi:hypothetical protein
VLEAYCNWLENRVVARFDAAVAEGNLRLQAQSVSIMIELDKERSIAQVGFAVAMQQHVVKFVLESQHMCLQLCLARHLRQHSSQSTLS